MENKKWAPSQEENFGVITSVYEFIKEELSELQKITGCPDSFIYDFIGKIQNEWHPESCHSIVCLLYTSPSPRDATLSRMPSSA